MTIYILPGYSEKNKIWADEVALELEDREKVKVVCWEHWSKEKADNWIEMEAQKIAGDLGNNERINIIAKSAGTMVCVSLLKINSEKINKIILCGIPVVDFLAGDDDRYGVLKTFEVTNVLCFQNENDPHGSYQAVETFISGINPNIKVMSKLSSDHEYPYTKDFARFLGD